MLIRLGYDIQFEMPSAAAMIAILRVHSSRAADLRTPDEVRIDPPVPIDIYTDSFGNVCTRFVAPAGWVRIFNIALIEDSGEPDAVRPQATQIPVQSVPPETLPYLFPSRYCEVDCFADIAQSLFGHTQPGWQRVQAICDWVYRNIAFGYQLARPTKTALEVYNERGGVCRDFQHLAITFCRCLGIPARYATGYLGDIGVRPDGSPMDFSAWFEAFLEDRWWTFDARHNVPRIGRVLMATGRDAADVAITTSFWGCIDEKFRGHYRRSTGGAVGSVSAFSSSIALCAIARRDSSPAPHPVRFDGEDCLASRSLCKVESTTSKNLEESWQLSDIGELIINRQFLVGGRVIRQRIALDVHTGTGMNLHQVSSDETEERLRREVLEAQALFEATQAKVREIRQLSTELGITSDGTVTLREAEQLHRDARKRNLTALQRFSGLVVCGKRPASRLRAVAG